MTDKETKQKQYQKDIFTPQEGFEVVEQVSDEDLLLINKFAKKKLTRDDVYVRSFLGVNDIPDRDKQRFTLDWLRNVIAPSAVGKAFGFDEYTGHPRDGRPGKGKIFKADVVNKNGANWVKASFYTIKHEKHDYAIEMMDAGIWSHVSIVFIAEDMVDIYDDATGEFKYQEFAGNGEVIKWDMVVLGSQRGAELEKAFTALKDSKPCTNCTGDKNAHSKPEETEDYIHIPVRKASDFAEGTFRTIDISKGEGIAAIAGKLKEGGSSMVVQKYLFAKSKGWTMDKAKKWVDDHKKDYDEIKTIIPVHIANLYTSAGCFIPYGKDMKMLIREITEEIDARKYKEKELNAEFARFSIDDLIEYRNILRRKRFEDMSDEDKTAYISEVLKKEYLWKQEDIDETDAKELMSTVELIKRYNAPENNLLTITELYAISQTLSKVIAKEGRVFSTKNRELLKRLRSLTKQVTDAIGELLDATEPTPSDDEKVVPVPVFRSKSELLKSDKNVMVFKSASELLN